MWHQTTRLEQTSVIDYHSSISETFDENYLKFPDFRQRMTTFSRLFSKHLAGKSTVLDAGCGTGAMSFVLGELGLKVCGIDASAAMIERCNATKRSIGADNVQFQIGAIPQYLEMIGLEKFDGIVLSSVLEYLPELDRSLNLITERLREDGVLIVSLPNTQSLYQKFERIAYWLIKRPKYIQFVLNQFSASQFSNLMHAKGLKCLDVEYFARSKVISRVVSGVAAGQYSGNLFAAVYTPSVRQRGCFERLGDWYSASHV